MLEHQLAGNEEIGRVEVVVGELLTTLEGMLRGCRMLVHGTEIAWLQGGDGKTTIGYSETEGRSEHDVEVLPEVVRVGEHHVTIDEQQPGITGLGGQEIADGSTANILRTLHKPAVRQLVDGTIGDLYSHIRRTIVSYEHLIVDVQGLCLLLRPVTKETQSSL